LRQLLVELEKEKSRILCAFPELEDLRYSDADTPEERDLSDVERTIKAVKVALIRKGAEVRTTQTGKEPTTHATIDERRVLSPFPSPPGLQWEEITAAFISNEAVKITARQESHTYTFAELGFKDLRKGDAPDSLWEFLKKGFARNRGE